MNNIRINIEMFKEAYEIQALALYYSSEPEIFRYAQEWESGDYRIHYGFDKKGNIEWGKKDRDNIEVVDCNICGEEIPSEIWKEWFEGKE